MTVVYLRALSWLAMPSVVTAYTSFFRAGRPRTSGGVSG